VTANDESFDRDALAADARELVEFVESVHPEPFLGYDGRVDLHATLERTVRDLPESAARETFYRQAAPLVAGLDDAHSLLRAPESDDGDDDDDPRELPISLRVVGEGLYVDAVMDEGLAHLLGGRLLAVEGESVDTLAERVGQFRGTENDYYARDCVGSYVGEYRWLDRLLGRESLPDPVTVRVRAGGEERSESLAPTEPEGGDDDTTEPDDTDDPAAELTDSFPHPEGSGPRYRLYEDGDAAVFVPGNLSDYRESFEAAMAAGASRVEEFAPEAYERHVGGDPPDEMADLVAELPSMADALLGLVDAMADADTETLIVDVRDNPGGDSQFVFHLAYVLAGFEGAERLGEAVKAVKRRTEPHRERFGSGDSDTADANPAEYDLDGFLDGAEDSEMLRRLLTRAEGFADLVETVDDEGRYEPERIAVVTSAGTMSSAFAVAGQLTALGAEVVGVPSGQAPISFGEAVERELSNTGLTARVACSMYHWVPDPDGRVLEPDAELTPERFSEYDHAGDAGLRLAFDHAGHTDGEAPTPVDD
jgi:hypothetical protein